MRRTILPFLAALAILTAAVHGRAAGEGPRRRLTPDEVAALVSGREARRGGA